MIFKHCELCPLCILSNVVCLSTDAACGFSPKSSNVEEEKENQRKFTSQKLSHQKVLRLRSSATHFIETKKVCLALNYLVWRLLKPLASHEGFDTLIQSVPQSGKVAFLVVVQKKKRKQFLGERINQAVIEKWMKNPQRREDQESSSFIMKQSKNTVEKYNVTNPASTQLFLRFGYLGHLYIMKRCSLKL